MMAGMLTEQLAPNREQLELLERTRREPWLLDDATVDPVKKVFGVQRDDMWLWEENGRRWQALDLDTATRAQVDGYMSLAARFATTNDEVLALADEIAGGTINGGRPSKPERGRGGEEHMQHPRRDQLLELRVGRALDRRHSRGLSSQPDPGCANRNRRRRCPSPAHCPIRAYLVSSANLIRRELATACVAHRDGPESACALRIQQPFSADW